MLIGVPSLSFPPGSFELRAGFATASTSASQPLSVESIVSKFRDRKKNTSFMLAGADCYADAQSRSAIKSPFDGDVVINMEIMVRRALRVARPS